MSALGAGAVQEGSWVLSLGTSGKWHVVFCALLSTVREVSKSWNREGVQSFPGQGWATARKDPSKATKQGQGCY